MLGYSASIRTFAKGALSALVATLALGASSAMAVPITPGLTLSGGGNTFSNISCGPVNLAGTGTASCGGLDVSVVNGNLQISGLIGSGANGSADLIFNYTVTGATPITAIDLLFNGTFNGTGSSRVTETVFNGNTIVGALTVTCNTSTNPCDLQDPPFESPPDIPLNGSFATLNVTKDIEVSSGGVNTGSASIS